MSSGPCPEPAITTEDTRTATGGTNGSVRRNASDSPATTCATMTAAAACCTMSEMPDAVPRLKAISASSLRGRMCRC